MAWRSIAILLVLFAARALPSQAPATRRPASGAASAARIPAESAFARLVERLSEPGGYFDTDNLISNEASYLHVIGRMQRLGVSGGAYIGVGPDQNFSYIAHLRPSIAFLIDIRRDNLLQHLLFKSLFTLARNRVEYLCLLFGKPFPDDSRRWNGRSIQHLVDYIDRAPARPERAQAVASQVLARVKRFGIPLTGEDLETIGRIHASFVTAGLDLRFTSFRRPPREYYPTFRQLLLEKDDRGRQANYLVREEDFRFIKSLQERNLVVPVVGDLAGPHALAEIGRAVAERGERVSAFYTSNVEFYLMRGGSFDRFAETVTQLPRDGRSVIIRSYFSGLAGSAHPQAVSGYYSTQLVQTIGSFVSEYESGGLQSYADVVTKHALPPP